MENDRKTRKMIYLASPYSHPDPAVRKKRFILVSRVAAQLMAADVLVFSPIAHSHPIAVAGTLPGDWAYWEEFDRRIISICDEVVVLLLDGWENSKGIKAELKLAKELGKKVRYAHMHNEKNSHKQGVALRIILRNADIEDVLIPINNRRKS